MRPATTACALLALASTLLAQTSERVLYVTALDASARTPVETLAPGDLRVTEDGRTREIIRVEPATSPMAVAILVDNQQAARATMADARNALTEFIRELDGVGPVALVTVADRPTILQAYTTNTAQLTDAVGRVFAQPDSGATLLDAIVEASRGLERRDEDRAAIVLLTTEFTEFSTLHYQQVLDRLKDGGAMLNAVVLTNQQDSLLNDASRNRAVVLDRGVNETGGIRVNVLASMGYANALRQVATALKAQHRVTYARPDTLIPPERIVVSATRDVLFVTGAPARGQKVR